MQPAITVQTSIAPQRSVRLDFEVDKLERQNFRQASVINSSEKHFGVVFYSDADQSANLLFKAPGEINQFVDHRNVISGFCMLFTEKFLMGNRQLLSIVTGFPFFEINLLKNRPLKIHGSASEEIKSLFQKIYDEFHGNGFGKLEVVSAYLQAFFLNVKRIYESHAESIRLADSSDKYAPGEIMSKFRTLVWLDLVSLGENALCRKSVSEYAEKLFIHPNYLYSVVKKETGKTAREYIDSQIFKLAKSLLLQEGLQIKEIAWQLSFNETAHFSNFFRRHAGMAPAEFRKQYLYATAL